MSNQTTPNESSPRERASLDRASVIGEKEGSACRLAASAATASRRSARVANHPVTDASRALGNLRGVVILVVVAFHSALAYLGSSAPSAYPFDQPPYEWSAFPIIDHDRWFGFDLFCAWQDVYLMSLMFFLSGLLTWPSLDRKGDAKFLNDRLWRLGLPFAFGVCVVMPLALYPVYRVTALDPSPAAYVRHYLALPFWPNGPMWFLWQLLALTIAAVGIHRFSPHWLVALSRISSHADHRPARYFAYFVIACALAYVPLAVAFTPWGWSEHGLLSLQLSRPLLYAVYYFAGLAIGAKGFERRLFARDGMMARHWRSWLLLALASLALWMALTDLTMNVGPPAPMALQVAADFAFVFADASSFFFIMAATVRFGAFGSRLLDRLSRNAYGLYLLHYAPVVWLQYSLLGVTAPAIAKALIVFLGAMLASWAAMAALRQARLGALFLGEEARALDRVAA